MVDNYYGHPVPGPKDQKPLTRMVYVPLTKFEEVMAKHNAIATRIGSKAEVLVPFDLGIGVTAILRGMLSSTRKDVVIPNYWADAFTFTGKDAESDLSHTLARNILIELMGSDAE